MATSIYGGRLKAKMPVDKEETMDFEGYCVKCRKKVQVKGGVIKETPNGRRMVQGSCPVCKTTVTRFLAAEKK